MSRSDPPVFCFSSERRTDMSRAGLTGGQIAAIEEALPACAAALLIPATLTDARDELYNLIGALKCLARVLNSGATKATREAKARWQDAAYRRGHPLGKDPEFVSVLNIDILIDAAHDAKKALGTDERRSHAANPEPIVIIYNALVIGSIRDGVETPSSVGALFRQIVQYVYEAIGVGGPDYVPERALRAFRGTGRKTAAGTVRQVSKKLT